VIRPLRLDDTRFPTTRETLPPPFTSGYSFLFDADGLPPSKPGQHYEVWLSDGRHGISAGTFRVGADGKARCTLATAGRTEYFKKVDVTVEPDVPPRTTEHETVMLGDI